MNAEEFIDAVYGVVYVSAIDGALKAMERPAGRRPRQAIVDLSVWFNGLADADKQKVGDVTRLAVDHAVFGILAVLDGARIIDDGGQTELFLRSSDGTLLNEYPELHDLFRAKVDAETGDVDDR
jgi:hypothetical protein